MITYFKSVNDTANPYFREVAVAIDRIRSGASKRIVEAVRSCTGDKTERNEIKRKLPAICFSGEFTNRNSKSIKSHSGLICIDFDGFESDLDLLYHRHKMQQDKYSYSVFTSPSGNGLKVLVKIPKDISNHKNYFLSLEKYYDCKEFDVACKDISRVCYESYDPDIYVNEDSVEFTELTVEEHKVYDVSTAKSTIRLDDSNEIVRRLKIWWNNKHGLVEGQRSNNVFILASALNDYGINKFEAINSLSEFASKDFNEAEIKGIIESAYKNFDAHGTKFFEDNNKIDEIKKTVKQGTPKEQVLKMHNKISPDLVEDIVEEVETDNSFWTKNSKGQVTHVNHLYKQYLESLGYRKYYVEGGKNFVFVSVDNNIISDITEDNIKDTVLDDLYNRSDLSIYNYFSDKTKLFEEKHLSLLDRIEPKIMRDNKDTAYLYFEDNVVKVTKDEVVTEDYMTINGYIWDKHRIDRKFSKSDYDKCDFQRFIHNIAGNESDRIDSMESTIGFLLHTYKPPKFCPAVICNDETISANPEGGTGKGLFVKGINQFRRTVGIDGKQFQHSKTFAYQRVSADTQVIAYEDVNKGFDFERLFSIITEGITLEKKNKDEIFIPFEKSPKSIITTNYAIKGTGNSHDRRRWDLEFAQYYSKNFTPRDEFGHNLFNDWDECEWSKFDNYMISCIQKYLSRGLIECKFKNLEQRKFIASTCHDFYEWCMDSDNKYTKLGACHDGREMMMAFADDYPDYSLRGRYPVSLVKFRHWLDAYGECAYDSRPEYVKDPLGGRCLKFVRNEAKQLDLL